MDAISLLVSAGADVNHCGPCSSSPLHLAANVNSPELVSWLLYNGAEATAVLDDGTTPLHCACQTGDGCDVASVLLEHASSLLCRTRKSTGGISGITVLHDATELADLMTVRVILKHEVDVDAGTSTGVTALHLAAKHGHVDIVAELLLHGAKIDVLASDAKGTSICPLFCAVENNHPAVIATLRDAGANINVGRSYSGRKHVTCLHVAVMRQNTELVRYLLAIPDIDANACDSDNATALHIAARGGFVDVTELLLQHGMDVNVGMSSGQSSNQTALHCAVRYRHVALARMLVTAGADVNATEKMAASKVPSGESCTDLNMPGVMMMMTMMRRFVARVLNSPQTCCQSQSNRWVLGCRANARDESVAVRREAGRLFQMCGSATAKLLISSVVVVLGTNRYLCGESWQKGATLLREESGCR